MNGNKNFELSVEDVLVIDKRVAAYVSGKDKGVSALEASNRMKLKLKRNRK